MRALVIILSLFTSDAFGQECKTWLETAAYLESYGQIQTIRAVMDPPSNPMAIFVNPENDTWSIVERLPTGCVQVQAQGIGWRWLYRRRGSE